MSLDSFIKPNPKKAPGSSVPALPSHQSAADFQSDDLLGNPTFSWEALEFEKIEKHPRWYWIMGIALLAIIGYALITNAILMAITFILIGMLGYIHAERDPRVIEIEINQKGIIVDGYMYAYDDIKSFWIYYEVEERIKILSLHSKKTFLPFVHIPVGDANPIQIRELLLNFIPEIRQELTIIDRMERMIGL
ncbi:MAG: hypothetical protein WC858_05510 [Parcubacteria group bacterium]|jgi:hypothetical protein